MNNEEYRDEGFRLYNEDREKALECFMKAAEGKDIPSGVAIAVYYYEDCEDDDANKHAKDWIGKVFEWYEEKEEEEYAFYVGAAHNLRGQMYYYDEYNNAMAWLEFCQAADLGYAGAYSFLGDMLYAGDWTADGNPDVNGALEQWQQGMELGDERSKELYEEHQHELMNDPVEVSFDNGNHYRGDVNAEGQPHGSGHMDYKLNGYYGEYDGEWKNGVRSGTGSEFENGRLVYRGKFKENVRRGIGTSYTADGRVEYIGHWTDGRKDGEGLLYKDGKPFLAGCSSMGILEGRVNEIRNGVVIRECIYTDGVCVYMREFSDDGLSVKYEGYVKDGVYDGMGCAFSQYGEKSFEGIFKAGKPFKNMKVRLRKLGDLPLRAKMIGSEYSRFIKGPDYVIERELGYGSYSGMLVNGRPSGKGTIIYTDHGYTGSFEGGKRYHISPDKKSITQIKVKKCIKYI